MKNKRDWKIIAICLLIFAVLVIMLVNENNKTIFPSEINSAWVKQILNLHVPSKYSDLCGFGAEGCQEFSFVNGELTNKIGEQEVYKDYPYMMLITDGVVFGNIYSRTIAVIPYYWVWGSSGYGNYVIERDNESLKIIGRIDMGKDQDYKIKINNDRIIITVNAPASGNEPYILTCAFIKDSVDAESLNCDQEK